MNLLIKNALQTSQGLRLVQSIVLEVWIGQGVEFHPAVVKTAEQMMLYGERVRGQPGHGAGPPHLVSFGAIVEAFSTATGVPSALQAQLARAQEAWLNMDFDEANLVVKACRVATVFVESDRKLSIGWGPAAAALGWPELLREALRLALPEGGTWRPTAGTAPATNLERLLQEHLDPAAATGGGAPKARPRRRRQ